MSVTPTSSFGSIELYPNMFQRLSAIGDVYEEFRFTAMQIRPIYATQAVEVLSYQPNIQFTANPASSVETAESGKSIVYSSTAPNVLPTLGLSRSELNQGPFKWYRYPLAGSASEVEKQGILWYWGGGTTVAYFQVDYEIEFRAPIHGNPSSRREPGEDAVVVPRVIEDDRKSYTSISSLSRVGPLRR